MTGESALRFSGLGKRYGRRAWALRDCTLDLPQGNVIGLVGANGAGKTTLLQLAIGLLEPTEGTVSMFGRPLRMDSPAGLAEVGFVAQDHPLYRGFSVADMLRYGRSMNPRFDQAGAEHRLRELNIPTEHRADRLSGGQQAQVALTLALAKQPRLLVLDEPVASLDPLARREFMKTLVEAVAETDLTVLLSSHVVTELERVCDHLVLLHQGRVRLAGDIDELLAGHRILTGPRCDDTAGIDGLVAATHGTRHSHLLVRQPADVPAHPRWEANPVGLEDVVLAYLARTDTEPPRPASAPPPEPAEPGRRLSIVTDRSADERQA
ncbi:ABC transporter ATP-binding protein [Catellatospora coxensis]|uniref:ABC transporter ATP-binding protein n=1 Tax=Catellatospora coxensis TaxID=310354 RepID=A0A8J3P8R1_9ACTN|nr:ABC transporter ATP-binding protein [Catellatospora coxensis]GIG05966.1 ABC transporter ATP-binding protein [Catellatospora coxensis]